MKAMPQKFLAIVFSLFLFSCSGNHVAPEIIFSTTTGEQVALSKLRGKPVLITFWATSCASCIKEVPHLIELYREFHPKGLELIAVAMPYDPPNHVLEFSKSQQLPYRVALDMQGEAVAAFNIIATPTTFLIAPNGNIVLQKTGLFDLNAMKNQLLTFIKE
ncbi:glutathione peroxidase [Patescibacteria group bacterium]|nr:glutathione peroxidase [Patescibacteria group bacterium]